MNGEGFHSPLSRGEHSPNQRVRTDGIGPVDRPPPPLLVGTGGPGGQEQLPPPPPKSPTKEDLMKFMKEFASNQEVLLARLIHEQRERYRARCTF